VILATVDSEATFTSSTAKSDIIISGGFNVSSKEVEDHRWHRACEKRRWWRDRSEWARRCMLRGPAADTRLTQVELIAFCRDKLAGIKCLPMPVEFIDELPRNALGKLIISELA